MMPHDRDAPIGTCRFDLELRYVDINPELACMNGWPVSEHIGKTASEIAPMVARRIEPQLRHVIDTGSPILNGVAYAETAAHPGSKRLYQHDMHAERDARGKIVGVSCVVWDSTREKLLGHLKRAHEDIDRITRQLRREVAP